MPLPIAVTAIIPTHNRSWILERSILSVFSQEYPHLELIVIDDGSTDQTDGVIENLQSKCPSHIDFQYYKQTNQGVSSARNFAARKARGELLAFLDSDDEWLPDKTARQSQFLKEAPHIPLVHGEEIWVRDGKRVNPKKKHRKSGGRLFQESLKLCLISPSCSMIRRESYWELGGFNEKFTVCEDYDFWLRLTVQQEVGFIQDPLIIKYGGHHDQLSQRYKAMDYWRVLSMWNLINSQSIDSREDHRACLDEILHKSQILMKGYKRHQNLTHLQEIENIHRQATAQRDGPNHQTMEPPTK